MIETDSKTDKPIGEMPIGESGYTVPWAATIDEHGNYWIRPEYTYNVFLGGTMNMKITRHEHGFELKIPEDSYWEIEDIAVIEHFAMLPARRVNDSN